MTPATIERLEQLKGLRAEAERALNAATVAEGKAQTPLEKRPFLNIISTRKSALDRLDGLIAQIRGTSPEAPAKAPVTTK